MQDRNLAPLAASSRVQSGALPATVEARRANHGGSAWSLPSRSRQSAELQPQDGSLANPARIATMPSRNNGAKLDCESEDARITGGTRSLSRRVLGLNDVNTADRKATMSRRQTPLPSQVA